MEEKRNGGMRWSRATKLGFTRKKNNKQVGKKRKEEKKKRESGPSFQDPRAAREKKNRFNCQCTKGKGEP